MSNPSEHHSTDHQHTVKGLEVFVGGLPRTVTENKIREVFSSCGEIAEIRLIKDQKGNLKGFCFIRFATKESADKAVQEKSGITLDGKKIGVLPSADQDTLFLGNLNKGWSADEFENVILQVFPDVVSVDLAMSLSSGNTAPDQKLRNRGFAFVKFSSHAAAARAYRVGSKSDFLLGGYLHPSVQWADEEPEIDPNELAKIKIAFVRNLPVDADEKYLEKLFEPFGKVDRVVVSKKGHFPVGFVHFAKRSDLDNAIEEMNEKSVEGPNGRMPFKLQVEVARPIDKNRKRAREDPQIKTPSDISNHSKFLKDDLTFSSSGGHKSEPQKEPVLADPYEAAVVSLPVVVKERLLRILRLGIATRFDIDIQSLTSIKELPESNAISVLDQFMLSGADKHDKGAYLTGLISRYQVEKTRLNELPLSLGRLGDVTSRESELPSFSSRVHLPVVDSLPSRVGITASRPDIYTSRYSSVLSDYPLSSRAASFLSDYSLSSRAALGKSDETSPVPLHRPPSSSIPYGRDGVDTHRTAAVDRQPNRPLMRIGPSIPYGGDGVDTHLTTAVDRQPTRHLMRIDPSTPYGRDGVDTHRTSAVDRQPTRSLMRIDPSIPYGRDGVDTHLTAAVDRQTTRPQMRFDPYTGEPYKFDPFTGEPIVPESLPRGLGSPY